MALSYEALEIENQQLQVLLEKAVLLVEELEAYLINGGYLGQEAGLIWQCKEFLGKNYYNE